MKRQILPFFFVTCLAFSKRVLKHLKVLYGVLYLRVLDPHFFEFFNGDSCDHFIDPLFIDFIREFLGVIRELTGFPVLYKNDVKLAEPVQIQQFLRVGGEFQL